jgi:two-component sensor histidine kinase
MLVLPGWARAAISGAPVFDVLDAAGTMLWVILEASVLMAVLRWSERRGRDVTQSVTLAIALASLCGAAISLAFALASQVIPGLGGDGLDRLGALTAVVGGAFDGCVILGAWTLVYILPLAVHEARARERERHELRRQAESARLRATLEPHFVLNTLNAIASLIGEAPELARELTADLGDLLREVVRYADLAVQPMRDEIAWLQRYARILETRHEGRLTVRFELDPRAADRLVPVLLLQPLVENAIHHGALQRPDRGEVSVSVALRDGALGCTVRDNGPGLPPGPPRPGATGLALVRRRLAVEAPGADLTMASGADGATFAITFPEPA